MFELYELESCPYCKKVIECLENKGITFEKKDISEPKHYKELLGLGGKAQVPFLYDYDSNIRLYESDKIIEFLNCDK